MGSVRFPFYFPFILIRLYFSSAFNKALNFSCLFKFLPYFCRPKKADLFRISHKAQKVFRQCKTASRE